MSLLHSFVPSRRIAYFSMEIALRPEIHTYAGGLGMLAGDVARACAGGALERMSIVALGLLPYISASIIMQLMTAVSPSIEQLKKGGETGRKKINQYTRYLTVFLSGTWSVSTHR